VVLSYEAVCFDLFGTLVTGAGSPIEGAREALNALPVDRWAIVTSCGAGFALALIAAAGLPAPRVLVSANDVSSGKPAPEPYALGAERLRFPVAQVLAVEDSVDGVTSAQAAGLDVVVIARGRGLNFASGAIAHVDRFSQIRWTLAPSGSIAIEI
jgi:sugar-phosphatase